jgi:hypothetical protein
MLRHVGFLGAMPPAIKGLKSAVFTEKTDQIFTLDFAEDAPMDDLKAALEAIFASVMVAMPDAIPQDQVDALMMAIDMMAETENAEEPATDGEPAQFSERQTVLDRREAAIAVREKAIATQQSKAVGVTIAAFCEDMCRVGKMAAGEKPKAIKLLKLASTAAVEYSEGAESALEMAMASYRDRKPLLTFGEVSRDVPSQSGLVSPTAEINSVELAAAARSLMAQKPELSYSEAMREIVEIG